TFRYKHDLDPAGIPQFGLVAEDVEKVSPDLVVRDDKGKPFSVRYEAVNAMLLNEFLKEHRKGQEQERKIALHERKAQEQSALIPEQQKGIKELQTTLKQQAAQIQRVSAQLETIQSSPQTVLNSR